MPNHITNIIKLEGDRLHIKKMLEAICDDEYGIGTIDFDKVIPMPKSLEIESGSRTDRGLKHYRELAEVYKELGGDDADLLNIPEKAEKAFLEQRKDIPEDEWELGKAAFKNILQYGTADWYDWRIANWGTKWNAYGYEDAYDEDDKYIAGEPFEFLTAWDAPHPVIEKISEMFPEVEITHEWADEDIGMNCGRKTYHDGIAYEEYYPEYGKESMEFAAEIQGVDLEDYSLYLNAAETKYISLYSGGGDEYELIELFDKPALFTNERITDADIPKGMYCYHIRHGDDGGFESLEKVVAINHAGSVVTKEPIDLSEKGFISFTEDTSPNFTGETMSLYDFREYDSGQSESEDMGMEMKP